MKTSSRSQTEHPSLQGIISPTRVVNPSEEPQTKTESGVATRRARYAQRRDGSTTLFADKNILNWRCVNGRSLVSPTAQVFMNDQFRSAAASLYASHRQRNKGLWYRLSMRTSTPPPPTSCEAIGFFWGKLAKTAQRAPASATCPHRYAHH